MSEVLEAPIVVERVSHYYGSGQLRNQILHEVSAEIAAGEIVILTGPSGSGKTTFLTLIGALRSAQQGSLRILGSELRGANATQRMRVRRKIGFIFQAHNLLGALTAGQNVRMALGLQGGLSGAEARSLSEDLLASVGLAERADHYPDQLSGGQKQRVAIARALVNRPRIILADEPTASLDKKSGRDVVELMHDLAKRQGCSVVLVTHDNRILDIADRILHMEDGRLTSYASEVMSSTRKMIDAMVRTNRSGELVQRLQGLSYDAYAAFLGEVTAEFEQFLSTARLSRSEAFESMQDQVLSSFSLRLGELLGAERTTVFVVDWERGELWSKVIGDRLRITVPIGSGIAGHVATTGRLENVPDAYADPRFSGRYDQDTGFRTRSILAVPMFDSAGKVQAVMQLLNKSDGRPFEGEDERRAEAFARDMGVILESWAAMRAKG
jgi:putative ABC transport system ATP-binding protein